jgi:asparagine synthetase B (glutamine-hydrolysing)
MCGITGWLDYERDLRAERRVVEAMTETLAAPVRLGNGRGPSSV